MIFPVPLFVFREWGTHIGPGHTCPECLTGRLEEYLVCPHCLGQVFLDAGGAAQCCGQPLSRAADAAASLQCREPHCRSFHLERFARNVFARELPARIGTLDTLNMPVFGSVQHYLEARPREGALHLADFTMDIDRASFPEALDALTRLLAPLEAAGAPHQVYFSGSKGFHVVVPAQALGAVASADLNTVQYANLARFLTALTGVTLDPSIYSRARLLREPLSLHGKTGLYKVPLRPGEYGHALELAREPGDAPHYLSPMGAHPQWVAWLAEAQAQAAQETAGRIVAERPALPLAGTLAVHQNVVPCVQSALDNGPPQPGTRNQLNKVMASFFLAQGDDELGMLDWARHTPGASSMPTGERVTEARRTYQWAKRVNYDFDCRDMKALGLCDPNCHLLAFVARRDLWGPAPEVTP